MGWLKKIIFTALIVTSLSYANPNNSDNRLSYSLSEKLSLILDYHPTHNNKISLIIYNKETNESLNVYDLEMNQIFDNHITVPPISSDSSNDDFFKFNQPELKTILDLEKVFVLKFKTEDGLKVLALDVDNLEILIQKKMKPSFYEIALPNNKNFPHDYFYMKQIKNGNAQDTKFDNGLLFTWVKYNPEGDSKQFAHSSLVFYTHKNNLTKSAVLTDSFTPVGSNIINEAHLKQDSLSNLTNIQIVDLSSGNPSKKQFLLGQLNWSTSPQLNQNLIKAEFKPSTYIQTDTTVKSKTYNYPNSVKSYMTMSANYLGVPVQDESINSTIDRSASSDTTFPPPKWPHGMNEINNYLNSLLSKVGEIIKGQPEALELIRRMELSFQTKGRVYDYGETVWLLGMPGSGKDTFVEAYMKSKSELLYPELNFDYEKHIYRLPVLTKENDLWDLTGSRKGHVGQGELTDFIRWLVIHSGGRYQIEKSPDDKSTGKSGKEFVTENPNWKPGMVLPGYYSPEEAVLFFNEFHDWNGQIINTFAKQILEKDIYQISGGSGLNHIQVPVTKIIASNHGISKLSSFNTEGKREGPKLSFEQMMEKWQLAHNNKDSLIEEIKSPTERNKDGGISPEIVSRIPKSNFLLLRPLNQEALESISKFSLGKLVKKYAEKKQNGFTHALFKFKDSVIKFVANYNQDPEDGARNLKDKLKSMIEDTLSNAILKGKIKESEIQQDVEVRRNSDGSYSLDISDSRTHQPITTLYMPLTAPSKTKKPVSDTELDQIDSLEEKLNVRVRGVKHIVKQIVRDLRAASNTTDGKAIVFGFFGLSSTGKTELAKALHQELYQTKTEPFTIEGNRLQSIEELKEKIYGKKVGNQVIQSEFMKLYDKSNGNLVLLLDEMTNTDPRIFNVLYEFLDKANPDGFVDGKTRPMKQVKVILNANLGEEWYNSIRRMDIPEVEQYAAARKIYETSIANENIKRNTLMKKFTEAFINRVGIDRFYFFGPHTVNTITELIQDKLVSVIKELGKKEEGKRSWEIAFASQEDYLKTVFSIEKYGFRLWSQGRSINGFISEQFKKEILDTLLKNRIPDGSKVLIRKLKDTAVTKTKGFEEPFTKVAFELEYTNNDNKKIIIPMEVKGRQLPKTVPSSNMDFLLTAIHEAGHSFLNYILLGDKFKPDFVSIIPGVTQINEEWIRYAGLASSEDVERMVTTREALVARLAVLLGGGVAEALSTKNQVLTSGHSNDLERVTVLARSMVVRFGLTGWKSVMRKSNQSFEEYFMTLTKEQQDSVSFEVDKLISDARNLAEKTLKAYYTDILIPVAKKLAAEGELKGDYLSKFYQSNEAQLTSPYDTEALNQRIKQFDSLIAHEAPPTTKVGIRDFEFHDFIQADKAKIFNLEKDLERKKNNKMKKTDFSLGNSIIQVVENLKERLLTDKNRSLNKYKCLRNYK